MKRTHPRADRDRERDRDRDTETETHRDRNTHRETRVAERWGLVVTCEFIEEIVTL